MNSNPDVETLKMTLWIASGVIGLLLAVIAYLSKLKINSHGEDILELHKVVKTVESTVNNLRTIVEVIKTQIADSGPRTEIRLNDHSKRLDEHERKISRIETACRFNHKE